MYALSIKQPWASLIISGKKPVENRTWSTPYRGKLLIHASKTWDKEGAEFVIEKHPELKEFINRVKNTTGALLGQVTMTDCVKNHHSEWFFGPYGFIFIQPREFNKPIPYKGALGIFYVPDEVVEG